MEPSRTEPATPAPAGANGAPVLRVRDLKVEFRTPRGIVRAVNGLSYDLHAGETLAILGESGSGKSVSTEAIMGILESPPGFITGGAIEYRGEDLLRASRRKRRRICGSRIAMIFQDPLSTLNPVYTVGWQIAEMYRVHQGASHREANERAVELLGRVGIPSPRERARDYPHQFSGGMRQRVMIAVALALDPDVLIADEPTTALDVTVQAQILELLARIQQEVGMGLILITHDLGVVTEVADRVAVMYAGRVVETGTVAEVMERPAHPYTRGLMQSVPRGDTAGKLVPIQGQPPDLARIPPGCAFHPRCPFAEERCRSEVPALEPVEGGSRQAACHFHDRVLAAEPVRLGGPGAEFEQ